MKFKVLVQARMGSKRLPGKSLMSLGGIPMLGQLLSGLLHRFGAKSVFVLTSSESENLPLVKTCSEFGVGVYQGDENNVASRFKNVSQLENLDYFIRLSGDSPFLDPNIIQNCLDQLKGDNYDLVTTVSDQPFPSGMNVELLKTSTFIEGYTRFTKPEHFEHVTSYFYENRNQVRIFGLKCPVADVSTFRFTVDTPDDFSRAQKLFSMMNKPHYEYSFAEKCDLCRKL